MPRDSELLRRRLGGRWAVSWQGYLLLLPVSIPLALLVVPAFDTAETWWTGVLIASLAYLAAGAVQGAAAITLLRHRRTTPSPVWLVVIVGGAAWLARSAVFAVALEALDLPVDTPIGPRLVTGFLLGALLVPGMAWLLASLDDFRVERERLLDALVRRELAAEGSAAYVDVMREDLLDRVESRVKSMAQSAALPADGDPDDTVVTAQRLEQLEQAVRATSRELAGPAWTQAEAANRVRAKRVIDAAARRPYTLWPLLPYLLIGTVFVTRFVPLGITLMLFVGAGVWAAAVAWTANAVCASRARSSVTVYIAFVVVMASGGVVVGLLVEMVTDESISLLVMLVISASLALVMVAGGVAHAVNVAEADVLSDMQASISAAEVRETALASEEARLRREIAIHLHGTVAANVTATALRLRQAMSEGNVVVAKASYVELRHLLELDMRASLLVERSDLDALLTELADSWTGLAVVTVDVDVADTLPPLRVREVVDVVTEAVSNAVRHGDARNIDVDVSHVGSDVVVTVVDDGRRRGREGHGLGSDLFDHVARGHWSLTPRDPHGSVLRLVITEAVRR